MTVVLFLAQRATAFVLAVAGAIHVGTILYATRGGLTAADILARTHSNGAFALFYGLFVLAVAIHAPIGLRTVVGEWLQWRGRVADACCVAVGLLLLALGWRAIAAVTL